MIALSNHVLFVKIEDIHAVLSRLQLLTYTRRYILQNVLNDFSFDTEKFKCTCAQS